MPHVPDGVPKSAKAMLLIVPVPAAHCKVRTAFSCTMPPSMFFGQEETGVIDTAGVSFMTVMAGNGRGESVGAKQVTGAAGFQSVEGWNPGCDQPRCSMRASYVSPL